MELGVVEWNIQIPWNYCLYVVATGKTLELGLGLGFRVRVRINPRSKKINDDSSSDNQQ